MGLKTELMIKKMLQHQGSSRHVKYKISYNKGILKKMFVNLNNVTFLIVFCWPEKNIPCGFVQTDPLSNLTLIDLYPVQQYRFSYRIKGPD